ncbi:hypothetical protein [Jannaschia sp. W003]|uniref:tetratricopeptide repeat protein n=1 Tax=Jannaschia sp. W003 TaxID=2867012 RepID=UPI0021A431F2|nr:hypothetical protein [Jannaschia sp. W003]UWQ20189.1 hypothetical protein K3554_09240 [Jannaschia sp. W003]
MNPIAPAALIALLAAPALAACPPAPDITAAMDDLIAEAQAATTEREGRMIGNRMWPLWATAPDARAQELLDEGMQRRSAFDLDGARTAFDALIDRCPDYAEGWNQRAFVRFLGGDFEGSLQDLDRALALRPRHVAALAGKGLALIQLGRIAEGQAAIRAATELNPWLSERQFLLLDPETGQPRPPQTDL